MLCCVCLIKVLLEFFGTIHFRKFITKSSFLDLTAVLHILFSSKRTTYYAVRVIVSTLSIHEHLCHANGLRSAVKVLLCLSSPAED